MGIEIPEKLKPLFEVCFTLGWASVSRVDEKNLSNLIILISQTNWMKREL